MKKICFRVFKVFSFFVVSLFLFIVGIYLYNEWLNSNIKVKYEVIEINDLPEEFEDFTILHFADLHGVEFGKKQKKLINLIKSLSYDVVAITGDVIDRHNPTLQPLYDLLDGIMDGTPVLFSQGNVDTDEDFNSIRNYGVEVMDNPFIIERNGEKLVFQKYAFYQKVDPQYDDSIVIGLGHEPFPQDLGYSLILVGHYHGGQIRIPGYGALFVPAVEGTQWVTDQSQIIGVQDFGTYSQHIAGGLGASADFKWLQKRWFNPPEINLLTLKSRQIN